MVKITREMAVPVEKIIRQMKSNSLDPAAMERDASELLRIFGERANKGFEKRMNGIDPLAVPASRDLIRIEFDTMNKKILTNSIDYKLMDSDLNELIGTFVEALQVAAAAEAAEAISRLHERIFNL
jgi:hypothetical protein